MNTKIIKLDINKKMYETISAKQGDTESRFLLFHLFDSSLPFDLTEKSVRVYGIKPDEKKIFNDLVINDAKKGYCTLELTNQMLSVAGLVKLELVIYKGSKKLSSIPFVLNVISSLNSEDAIVSTNEFTALMNGLSALSEYDTYKSNAKQVPVIKEEVSNLSAQLDNKASKADMNAMQEDFQTAISSQIPESTVKNTIDNYVNTNGILPKSLKDIEEHDDTFYITDNIGNILLKIDSYDIQHAVIGSVKNILDKIVDINNSFTEGFYITDNDGNIAFKVDREGVSGINLVGNDGGSVINTPYTNMKLITIGDSLSTEGLWQKVLVDYLGVKFNNDENKNGANGHKPMSKGGTAILPNSEDSIYMRALDAKYYEDKKNGTLIIVYAGQNDYIGSKTEINDSYLGTINDTPYIDRTVYTDTRPSFYSYYMGMIENLITDCPQSKLVLVTQMPIRIDVDGNTMTQANADKIENVRYAKVKAIREIAEKYNLPLIDLWKNCGINHLNSTTYYGNVVSDNTQVHPNNEGYKTMGICAVRELY